MSLAGLVPPAAGALAAIRRAAERGNPVVELEVDLLAVARVAQASTHDDWTDAGTTGGTAGVSADPTTGAVTIARAGASALFQQQTGSASVLHRFLDSVDGGEAYWLDFWPDPSLTDGAPLILDSVVLWLGNAGAQSFTDTWRFRITQFDEFWRRVDLCDPIDVPASAIPWAGGAYTLDLTTRLLQFGPGHLRTWTGSGRTASGTERTSTDTEVAEGVTYSRLLVPKGFSIGIQPVGKTWKGAFLGAIPSATVPPFDTTQFWRVATNRNLGPYDPRVRGYSWADTTHQPGDQTLATGAVPGAGAIPVGNGAWGVARQVTQPGRAQAASQSWEQPYHALNVRTFAATGTQTKVLDLGAVPTHEIAILLDDWTPAGTSISYTIEGSSTAASGPWTSLGAVADGDTITAAGIVTAAGAMRRAGSAWYRWYRLTATLHAGPAGGPTYYATPALQRWAMVERTRYATFPYAGEVDASVKVDPVTAQAEIEELKLPLYRLGLLGDPRDQTTTIATQYAPTAIEAHVYAVDRIGGTRYFLNSYHLENREPGERSEAFTFLAGLDRLKALVPPAQETFTSLGGAATAVTPLGGAAYRIGVAGTPFPTAPTDMTGYRVRFLTGSGAGNDFAVSANTTSTFDVTVASASANDAPAIGDTFEIHSDSYSRPEVLYVGADFADIFADVRDVQAQLPARYRGARPPHSTRTATGRLTSDGRPALDVLQELAVLNGGLVVWDRGQVHWVDLYGPKTAVLTWDERHLAQLETTIGAQYRMPVVDVKYNYDLASGAFANEQFFTDYDALTGWGLPNLFDVQQVPDSLCRWLDQTSAEWLATTLLAAWRTGVRVWRARTVFAYPWLRLGDAVTIVTDQYTDRRIQYAGDGITDLGTAVAGRVSALGVVVGKNLWGTEFLVAVRGLDAVMSGVAATGALGGPLEALADPALTLSIENEGASMPWAIVVGMFTPPDSPYYDHVELVGAKSAGGTPGVLWSGRGGPVRFYAAWGQTLSVTVYTYTRNGTKSAGTAQSIVVPDSASIGRWVKYIRPSDGADDGYAAKSTDTAGETLHVNVTDANGRDVGGMYHKPTDTADAVSDGATKRVTTHSEADGGGRAYGTIDSGGVVVSGGIDLSRPYTGKHLGNIPDDAGSDRHAATSTEKTGGSRAATAIDAGGVLVPGAIDLARGYTNKHLGNIPDDATSDRHAATATEKTGGGRAATAIDAGNILVPTALDFSRAYTGKHAGNLPRAAGSGIAIDAVTQHLQDDGHAAATMQDSAGRAINGFFDKVTDLVDDSLYTSDTSKRLATAKYHLPPFVESVSATTGTYQVTVKATLRSAIGATVQCRYRTVALGFESNDYSTPAPSAHEALQAQPYPVVLTIDRDSDSASDRTLEFWAQDQYGNVSPIQRVTIPKMTVTDSSNATSSINVVTSFTNGGVCPCFLNDAISWSKAASLPSTWTIELWWDDTGGGAPFSGTLLNSGASLTSYTNGLASAPTGTTRSFNRTYGVRVRNSYAHYLQADTFTPSVAHAGADCAG